MDNIRNRCLAALLGLGAVTVLASGCSTTAASGPTYNATGLGAEETSIPFARMDMSINDWQADGQDGIWVQDARRDWYYARTLGPCTGLDWANVVGFDTNGTNLDKFSAVVVPRDNSRCPFTSFRRSDPPPKSTKKRESEAAAPVPAATPTPAAPAN